MHRALTRAAGILNAPVLFPLAKHWVSLRSQWGKRPAISAALRLSRLPKVQGDACPLIRHARRQMPTAMCGGGCSCGRRRDGTGVRQVEQPRPSALSCDSTRAHIGGGIYRNWGRTASSAVSLYCLLSPRIASTHLVGTPFSSFRGFRLSLRSRSGQNSFRTLPNASTPTCIASFDTALPALR